LDVLGRDEAEGVARGGLCRESFEPPFGRGVFAVRQKFLGGVASFPRIGERDDRIRAEGEDALLAEVAVLEPSELRAVGLDEEVPPPSETLKGLSAGLVLRMSKWVRGIGGIALRPWG
jgi:hypothetical protein